jgi:hypothetical protein
MRVDPMIAAPVDIPPLMVASNSVEGFMNAMTDNPPKRPPQAAASLAPIKVMDIGFLKKNGSFYTPIKYTTIIIIIISKKTPEFLPGPFLS